MTARVFTPLTAEGLGEGDAVDAHSFLHGQSYHVWENVLAHGAELDGVSDDRGNVIQAAEAVSSPGGCVYIPAGVCLINGVLPPASLAPGTTFKGAGRDATVMQFDNSGGTIAIDATDLGLQFEDMTIRGGTGTLVKFAGSAGSFHSAMRRVHMFSFVTGIEITDTLGVSLEDVELDTSGVDGIKIHDGDGIVTTTNLDRVHVQGLSGWGIKIEGNVTNTRLHAPTLEGNATGEMRIAATAGSDVFLVVIDKGYLESAGTPPAFGVVTVANGAKRVKSLIVKDATFGGTYSSAVVDLDGSTDAVIGDHLNASSAPSYSIGGAVGLVDTRSAHALSATTTITAYADTSSFAVGTGYASLGNARVPISASFHPTLAGMTLQVRMRLAAQGFTAADSVDATFLDDNGINPTGTTNFAAVGGDEWLTTSWVNAPAATGGWWPSIRNNTAARGNVRRCYVDFRYA